MSNQLQFFVLNANGLEMKITRRMLIKTTVKNGLLEVSIYIIAFNLLIECNTVFNVEIR